MTTMVSNAKNAWREHGYRDGAAGRPQRAPLRDDSGEAFSAYMTGYRLAMRERGRDIAGEGGGPRG